MSLFKFFKIYLIKLENFYITLSSSSIFIIAVNKYRKCKEGVSLS
jgi:hypothetical protein